MIRIEHDSAFIEVSPQHGFNCLRWNVGGHDVLYKSPDWDTNPVPTRSGHPILFPFPNRMKHARFEFEGQTYQLRFTDSTGQHAIHGFTPKTPWRVLDQGKDFVTGEFQLSKDKPECAACWPADCRIRVTYRMLPNTLKVEARIDAADGKPLPFGLGYHPYFVVDGPFEEWNVHTWTMKIWDLEEGFPEPVGAWYEPFAEGRAIDGEILDNLYGIYRQYDPIAELTGKDLVLSVSTDESFRELLLFTPPHRKAIAIEPYTCATDAANLAAKGVDSGWRVLPAGEVYTSSVEYRVSPAS